MPDGTVVADSHSSFGKSNYLTVLLKFENPIFTLTGEESKTFDEIQKMAFKGSDYSLMNDRLKIELKERDIYGFEKDIICDNSDVFLKVDRVYKDENNKYIAEYDVAGFKSQIGRAHV